MVRMVKLLGLDGGGNRWTGCLLVCDRDGLINDMDVRRTDRGRLSPDDVFDIFEKPDYLCVDAPMGGRGKTTDFRPCDRGARARLGSARQRVFQVPSENRFQTYLSNPNATQAMLNGIPEAKKLSIQAFSNLRYIAAAEELKRRMPCGRVIEGHPEVAFAVLNGGTAIRPSKRTPAGNGDRLALLPFNPINRRGHDEVDACVMAHVAWCYWRRTARAVIDENGPVVYRRAKCHYPAIWMP